MNFIGMFLLALGLSMDAFAVAVCRGLGLDKVRFRDMFIVGLYFGIFQAVMPLIGYFAATYFSSDLSSFGSWIAFALLSILGVRMILGGLGGPNGSEEKVSLGPAAMLPLAIATSIDALAVGVSFAFIDVNIFHAVLIIGVTTFALSMIGVKMGRTFGERIGPKAEIAGGVILVLIGLKILLDGLGIT
jgi:putative Mn2+ efflux pump MntP